MSRLPYEPCDADKNPPPGAPLPLCYFVCWQCGITSPPQFVLNDDVWALATNGRTEIYLCIECAEDNLGRPIAVHDLLQGAPINAWWMRRLWHTLNAHAKTRADPQHWHTFADILGFVAGQMEKLELTPAQGVELLADAYRFRHGGNEMPMESYSWIAKIRGTVARGTQPGLDDDDTVTPAKLVAVLRKEAEHARSLATGRET